MGALTGNRKDPVDVLKKHWGYETFRGVQRDIIDSVLAGKDTIGLMPTGGGKSICFQVPTLCMGGLCIIVSPLVSLMQDQVRSLRKKGLRAEFLHSGMTREERGRAIDNCLLGPYHFLYVSPERVQTRSFQARLHQFGRVCLICVDEAHCISQWGHDFRPAYLCIPTLRELLPHHVPLLALTATATPPVIKDMAQQLQLTSPAVVSMSFERANLTYTVRKTSEKVEAVISMLKRHPQDSAIVYVRTRGATVDLAQMLDKCNITAEAYHAGLSPRERQLRQQRWTLGRRRVMVATNAFGMGIDKSDVRLVLHVGIPDSPEAYFQEAGRAGRDGLPAEAALFYGSEDIKALKTRPQFAYPEPEYIKETYDDLCYYLQIGIGEGAEQTRIFHMDEFCRRFRRFPLTVHNALSILDNAGYLQYDVDPHNHSRLQITVTKEDLYLLDARRWDPDTNKLLEAILREYVGVFADMQAIDEAYLQTVTGLDQERIYELLKRLVRRRIIRYIPQNNTPTVSLKVPRIMGKDIHLKPEAYATRKEEFIKRTKAMLHYVENTEECRSVTLLRYFGEQGCKPCGSCDVCRGYSKMRDVMIRAMEAEEEI